MNSRSFMRRLAAVFAAPSAVISTFAVSKPVTARVIAAKNVDFSIQGPYVIGTFIDHDEEQGDWIDQSMGRPKGSLHHLLGVPYDEHIPKEMLQNLIRTTDNPALKAKAEFAIEMGRWVR